MRMNEKQFAFFNAALRVFDDWGFCKAVDFIMNQVKQKKYCGQDGQVVLAEIYKVAAYEE